MRRFFNLLLLAALIVVLAVNNPTKAEYVAWAKEQQMAQSKDPLSKAAVALFSGLYFDNATTTHNFVVFSVFETAGPDGKTQVVVGCLKNFFPLGTR